MNDVAICCLLFSRHRGHLANVHKSARESQSQLLPQLSCCESATQAGNFGTAQRTENGPAVSVLSGSANSVDSPSTLSKAVWRSLLLLPSISSRLLIHVSIYTISYDTSRTHWSARHCRTKRHQVRFSLRPIPTSTM